MAKRLDPHAQRVAEWFVAIEAFVAEGRRYMPGGDQEGQTPPQPMLIMARRVADVYDPPAVERLKQLCLTDGQTYARNSQFSRTHLIRLATVEEADRRRRLEEETVLAGWSVDALQKAISAELGTRATVNRRTRPPESETDLALDVEKRMRSLLLWLSDRRVDTGVSPPAEFVRLYGRLRRAAADLRAAALVLLPDRPSDANPNEMGID